MIKIFHVALREFLATVLTKGFIIGMLLPPIMIVGIGVLMPLLMNKAAPKVSGHIAVIDQSGRVSERLSKAFSQQAMRERREKRTTDAMAQSPVPIPSAPGGVGGAATPQPEFTVRLLPPESDVDEEKAPILTSDGRSNSPDRDQRLALAVIPAEAVTPLPDGKGYKSFDLFVAPKLDIEVRGDLQSQIREAIVDARIEQAGMDVAKVRAITARPDASTKAVTSSGDKKNTEIAQLLIPGAFMLLLWISVFTCGQYLLSSTIEEKSNRVMEVLLSAVSPMQLMTGKIVGQMAVGALIIMLYGGAGFTALIAFAMRDFVHWSNLVYLGVYFVIAFSLIACMMAAVGSAVNDIREAQSLLGPIMIVLIIPMALWMPILRNPNSPFAQVCSFVPPISPFVMVLRISGSEPIPTWQIPASILVGFLYVLVFLWATAKIFRVGVLMYGKPPNLATLFRWIRMA